jgi:hypothetical protein
MRRLDPRIHRKKKIRFEGLDCRVNPRRRGDGGSPGHDER